MTSTCKLSLEHNGAVLFVSNKENERVVGCEDFRRYKIYRRWCPDGCRCSSHSSCLLDLDHGLVDNITNVYVHVLCWDERINAAVIAGLSLGFAVSICPNVNTIFNNSQKNAWVSLILFYMFIIHAIEVMHNTKNMTTIISHR